VSEMFCSYIVNLTAFQIVTVLWSTQKIFMGGISFNGISWLFAFGVRCLWRHNLTS